MFFDRLFNRLKTKIAKVSKFGPWPNTFDHYCMENFCQALPVGDRNSPVLSGTKNSVNRHFASKITISKTVKSNHITLGGFDYWDQG